MARVQPFTWEETKVVTVKGNDIHVLGEARELVIFCGSEADLKGIMHAWASQKHGPVSIPHDCKFTLRHLPKRAR
jgi:hypothetical protein